ncbi:MAG: hypothetical protein HC837_21090 [Chloroflexaceae bacterium]|nr:hypothetical protein [Chloroflexaceae bacterium]
MRRFAAPNVQVFEGLAPDACLSWPDPHAVFIGGSGGHLSAIVTMVLQRLHANGRLVINLVTLEHLYEARTVLPDARVIQVQIHTGVPVLKMLRFEAANPIFMVTYQKQIDL